jgi:hypothetical protein
MNVGRIEKVSDSGEVSMLYDAKHREAHKDSKPLGGTNETNRESQRERAALPEFPEAAWRGMFADYRVAMGRATEVSDAFHFASLWVRCAVALGRHVHFSYGMQLFPNVYLVCFGQPETEKPRRHD